MKKTVLFLLAPIFLLLSSCSVRSYIQKGLVSSRSSITLSAKDYYIVDKISIVLSTAEIANKVGLLNWDDQLIIDESYIEEELLKKAWELGADEIVNVRIWHNLLSDTMNGILSNEYHGTALAIKYKDAAPEAAKPAETQPQSENAPKARARRSQRTQQN